MTDLAEKTLPTTERLATNPPVAPLSPDEAHWAELTAPVVPDETKAAQEAAEWAKTLPEPPFVPPPWMDDVMTRLNDLLSTGHRQIGWAEIMPERVQRQPARTEYIQKVKHEITSQCEQVGWHVEPTLHGISLVEAFPIDETDKEALQDWPADSAIWRKHAVILDIVRVATVIVASVLLIIFWPRTTVDALLPSPAATTGNSIPDPLPAIDAPVLAALGVLIWNWVCLAGAITLFSWGFWKTTNFTLNKLRPVNKNLIPVLNRIMKPHTVSLPLTAEFTRIPADPGVRLIWVKTAIDGTNKPSTIFFNKTLTQAWLEPKPARQEGKS